MSLILKSNISFDGDMSKLPPFLPTDLYKQQFVAYGLRQLSAQYPGAAIRVRRATDDDEQDIGFTSAYGLDTAALEAFVGAGDGFVTTLYDQSGAGRHATQPTPAAQPKIAVGGVTTTSGGVPSVLFNGTSDWFDMALAAGAFSGSDRTHFFASLRSTKTSGTEVFFSASSSTTPVNLLFTVDFLLSPRAFRTVSRRTPGDTGGSAESSVAHANQQRVIVGDTNWLAGTGVIRQDGAEVGTVALSSSAASVSGESDAMYLGTSLLKSAFFGGYLTELVIYNSGGADVRAGLEANMLKQINA